MVGDLDVYLCMIIFILLLHGLDEYALRIIPLLDSTKHSQLSAGTDWMHSSVIGVSWLFLNHP